MRMWTRPPVKLRAGSSDRAPSYGPCGQALEKLALPHRLPTLGALAPTSSPLLQQRFMRTATAPTPTASQIAPSSQAIRLRNKPANSPGGSTRQSAKQHSVRPALRASRRADLVETPLHPLREMSPLAPACDVVLLRRTAQLPQQAPHRVPQQIDIGRVVHVSLDHKRITAPAQRLARLFSCDRVAALHH